MIASRQDLGVRGEREESSLPSLINWGRRGASTRPSLDEMGGIFMRHDAASWIKRMRRRELEQIRYVTSVNIGEAEQATREIRGIVIRAKYAAKLLVEHVLRLIAAKRNMQIVYELRSRGISLASLSLSTIP